jgi:flagellin-like hook-associated protein FlgL
MSNDILVSAGVRSNLLALQQTTDQISATQGRLATGKKVNTALDNASNFFLSASFRNSANALNSLLDGISTANRTLDAANAGITSLTTLMNSAQGSLSQALASAPTTAVTTGSVTGLTGASAFAVAAGHTMIITDGTTISTFTATASTTVQQVLDFVNTAPSLKVRAELSGDGRILLEAQGANLITITAGGSMTPLELAQFGLAQGTTNGGALNSSRTAFAAQYDALRTQIDQLAADSSYNGVSLLNGGGLKVVYNEKATSVQNLVGVTDTATGLGIAASVASFQTNTDINNAIASITNALTTLKTQASTFASNVSVIQARTEFTKSMMNTLNTGADGLVLADANEEGANLLALQTRQQLSSTALSLATQADQAVLRLFR